MRDDERNLVVDEPPRDRGQRRLQIASAVCLVFVVGEFIAGYIANSVAVKADAAHMLVDLMSFGVSLIALKLAEGKATKHYTFGMGRAEILGALFSIVLLWIIAAIITCEAVFKFVHHDEDINADVMIWTAVTAIVFNIILGAIFMSSGNAHMHSHHGQQHSHGHNHDGDAVNIRAAMIHIIGDLVQSIGVLVAGLIIKFVSHEQAWLADPITTLIFIVIMLITTLRVVRDLVAILMNRTDVEQYDRILRVLQSNGDNVHQLHIWTIVPGEYVVSAHLTIKKIALKSEAEVMLLTEDSLKKIEPGIKCLTLQTNCSCVYEDYCHCVE